MASEAAERHQYSKRRKLDYTADSVEVVLKDKKRVTVHESILCKSSRFFLCRCVRFTTEPAAKVGPIEMLQWEESEFLTYVHWLYTGMLDIAEENWPTTSAPKPSVPVTYSVGRLFECYRLGDSIGDRRFCNVLTDHLLEYWKTSKCILGKKRTPNAQTLANIRPDCGMNRLLADFYVAGGNNKENLISFQPQFILTVAQGLIAERETGVSMEPEKRGKCYYHDHQDATDKCHD